MPASAQQDPISWIRDGLYYPTNVVDAGLWSAPTGEVIAVDPITLFAMDETPIAVPRTAAEVIGLLWIEQELRGGALALVWSNAPVACGEEYVGLIGVDTGLAAFMTPADLQAMTNYGTQFDGDLYAGPYAEQIDTLYPGPFLPDLPAVTGFPLIGSGWGDGGYPVSSLYDADGNMIALYAQFITREDREWLLPPPCSALPS